VSAPDPNVLYKAARRLAREGNPVFPCRPVDVGERSAKSPLTRNGFKDGSTDRDQIKAWWRAHGSAAIGFATGHVWDVLDVDIKKNADGRVHLPMLQRLGLLNGCKRVVRTPSGGWHLYFLAYPGLTNKARGATLGLDVRGLGGYVLAPPSWIRTRNTEGEVYEGSYEEVGATTGGTDDPLMWDLIVSALEPRDTQTRKPIHLLPSERRASLAALREWVSILAKGERNNGLFWAVSRCIEAGIDPHELVEPALLTGLGEEEILRTVDSALLRAGLAAEELDTEAEAMFPDDVDDDE
jgi:hypothetical protein